MKNNEEEAAKRWFGCFFVIMWIGMWFIVKFLLMALIKAEGMLYNKITGF